MKAVILIIVALFLFGNFSTLSFQNQPYISKRQYCLGRRCAASTSSSTEKKSQTDQMASALVVTAATVASVLTMKVMVDAITPIITLSGELDLVQTSFQSHSTFFRTHCWRILILQRI